MAYDEALAERVTDLMCNEPGFSQRKMFGCMCYLIYRNMVCGVLKDELMVRVGKPAYEECLALPHAREMDFTGRTMRGMVYVGVDGIEADEDLSDWVERGASFARSLPPK
ncbi:MAG: hypothetical protein ACI9MC_000902 [Kiritimatiellia bacterium]|jgi:hypothetical protein